MDAAAEDDGNWVSAREVDAEGFGLDEGRWLVAATAQDSPRVWVEDTAEVDNVLKPAAEEKKHPVSSSVGD